MREPADHSFLLLREITDAAESISALFTPVLLKNFLKFPSVPGYEGHCRALEVVSSLKIHAAPSPANQIFGSNLPVKPVFDHDRAAPAWCQTNKPFYVLRFR